MNLEVNGVSFEFAQGIAEAADEECARVLSHIAESTNHTDIILIQKISAEKGIDTAPAIKEFCQKFVDHVIIWVTGTRFSGNAIHAMIAREQAEQCMFGCLDFAFMEEEDVHYYMYLFGAGCAAYNAVIGSFAGNMMHDVLSDENARKAMLKGLKGTRNDLLESLSEMAEEAKELAKADSF